MPVTLTYQRLPHEPNKLWGCKVSISILLPGSVDMTGLPSAMKPPEPKAFEFRERFPYRTGETKIGIFHDALNQERIAEGNGHLGSYFYGPYGTGTGEWFTFATEVKSTGDRLITWYAISRAERESVIRYLMDLRQRLQAALEEYCVTWREWLETVYQPAMLDIAAVDPGDDNVIEISDSGIEPAEEALVRHVKPNGRKKAA